MTLGRKIGLGAGGLLLGAVLIAAVLVQRIFTLTAVKLDDKLWVWLGGGGNTAGLLTDKGVVLVDTKLWLGASRLFEQVHELDAGAVRAIINTHHHLDHTHGNPLAPRGTPVYAAAPVKELLLRFDGDFWKDEPARGLLPTVPFSGATDVDFGGEAVRLIQVPASHTGGGDALVLFPKHRVIHAGDVYLNGYYPNIDLASGGSVPGYQAALDVLLSQDFDTVIPGHGPLARKADVKPFRDYMVALWEYGKGAAARNQSASEALAAAPASLRGMEGIPGITSLEKNLAWAIEEARRPLK